jgi:hypothetical protein
VQELRRGMEDVCMWREERGKPMLEFTPTDELIEELEKRFDAIVFAGASSVNEESSEHRLYFNGNTLVCIGLCHRALNFIDKDWMDKPPNTNKEE